jgi:hypothetical protein
MNCEKFGLSDRELNAIKAHMFPFSLHMPKSWLAAAVSIADKLATPIDFLAG